MSRFASLKMETVEKNVLFTARACSLTNKAVEKKY
jgi:hypothetical protein